MTRNVATSLCFSKCCIFVWIREVEPAFCLQRDLCREGKLIVRINLLEKPSECYTCVSCMYGGVEQNQIMLQFCSPGWSGLWEGKFFLCTIGNVMALLMPSVYCELPCSPLHIYVVAIKKETKNEGTMLRDEFLEKGLTPG